MLEVWKIGMMQERNELCLFHHSNLPPPPHSPIPMFPHSSFHRSLIAFWNILAKDFRAYYLKPPNISWGLIFPLAWTGMFFIRSGAGLDSVPALLPGVIAVSVWNHKSAGGHGDVREEGPFF